MQQGQDDDEQAAIVFPEGAESQVAAEESNPDTVRSFDGIFIRTRDFSFRKRKAKNT